MPRKAARRRSPGEGGAYSYKVRTRAHEQDSGERWYWKAVITAPDGAARQKVKRGFTTKKAALDDMREAQSAAARGAWTEPSKQPTGSYLDDLAGRAAAGAVHRGQLPQERPAAPRALHRRPCRWPR